MVAKSFKFMFTKGINTNLHFPLFLGVEEIQDMQYGHTLDLNDPGAKVTSAVLFERNTCTGVFRRNGPCPGYLFLLHHIFHVYPNNLEGTY